MPITELLATEGESIPANPDAIDVDPDAFFAVPNSPFVFVADPDVLSAWSAETVHAGPGVPAEDVGTWWLLLPRKLVRKPGLDGFRKPDPRRPGHATDVPRDRVKEEGGIWLDHREHGYLAQQAVVHPGSGKEGLLYHEVFELPIKPRKGQRVHYRYDRQRYLRWLLSLHRAGTLPAPSDDVLAYHRDRLDARAVRIESDSALSDPQRDKRMRAVGAAADRTALAQPADGAPPAEAKPARKRKPAPVAVDE